MINPPAVVIGDGGEAPGMAAMVAELLEANLADSPGRARVAARARGSVALEAADRGLGVTITFLGADVVVSGGALPGAPTLSGSWVDMAQVCTGERSPLRALIRRKLRVLGRRSPGVLVAASFALKVPRSAYGARSSRRS